MICFLIGRVIQDKNGNEIPVQQFKELYENHEITDMNIALQRLINYDFNFEKLDKFYAGQE